MRSDLRGTPEHEAVQTLYRALWQPGTPTLHGARELDPVGDDLYFTGTSVDTSLEAGATAAIYRLGADGPLASCWPGARLCRVSASRGQAACVHALAAGGDEVRLVSIDTSSSAATWAAPGIVEFIRWSPNGERLLLLVAGGAADVAGVQGGFALRQAGSGPAWMPEVTTPGGEGRWRSLWVWQLGQPVPLCITCPPFNPWEAAWCGNDAVLAVASDDHGEGSWYRARLLRLSIAAGDAVNAAVEVCVPRDQIGCPTGSPDGEAMAWIEAVCSDRGLVCGSLMLKVGNGAVRRIDTRGVEVTDLAWRNNGQLVVAGVRGFETVVAEWDLMSDRWVEFWVSTDFTLSGWQPQVVPAGPERTYGVMEAYSRAPAIVELSSSGPVARCALGPRAIDGTAASVLDCGSMGPVTWTAPDGLEIQGWLILPPAACARPLRGWPLLVDIHGGPIWAHRNRWAANLRAAPVLAKMGWAVLLPNPRGSSGRGQDFARQVVGDMGGADAHDITAGIAHLVASGFVDSERIAVSGTSYGGFMSCWLMAQGQRLAASIPISPVSNWTSQHFASQIPWFDAAFLKASPQDPSGAYFTRSPVFHVGTARTPTLVMAGGRDKNTPTSQALEFYNAILEIGAPCALAVYPEDGHSLRGMPAYVDSAARIVGWLTQHVTAEP
jgi:dipeptidyl aminopeptidase/acylaminoacyl peptidase